MPNLLVVVQSNEWTGKHSFGGRSLHHLGQGHNPYEEVINTIGTTLSSFDDDQLVPAYGFGDGKPRGDFLEQSIPLLPACRSGGQCCMTLPCG
jgi:E3 ubiquitin-protein ligase RGLG